MEKVVIVTGGSRGIGREIVISLARENYKVILNYNKSENAAKEIKESLKSEGYNIEIYKADVSKIDEVKKMVEYVLEKYNRIDVLVNNAGIAQFKLFTEISKEDWDSMIANNLTSVFYMTQNVVPNMIHNKEGCIINISSIWGVIGGACESHYSAAKAGVDGLTKALAKELGPSNIRVNSIAPGVIDTDMNQNITDETMKEIIEETPIRKVGRPEDIAKCIKWLIEDNFTTGQVISINGGWGSI